MTERPPVVVRPVQPRDKATLLRAFERLGPESRYRRFLSPKSDLSPHELAYLTEVDQVEHVALVAIDGADDEVLGVARFIRPVDDRSAAEAAVAVVDDRQAEGIGSLLLERLADRARELGVERFTADVLPTNRRRMEELFGHVGAVDGSLTYGAVRLKIDLRSGEPSGGVGHALRAAAAGIFELGLHPTRLLRGRG